MAIFIPAGYGNFSVILCYETPFNFAYRLKREHILKHCIVKSMLGTEYLYTLW